MTHYCTAPYCGRVRMERKANRAASTLRCPRCEKEFSTLADVRWSEILPTWFCVERVCDG